MARRLARDPLRLLSVAGAVCAALTPAPDAPDQNGPVWVQVCEEGTYLGHAAAKKLDWGPDFFAGLVARFRAHPAFRCGLDGVGCQPVIPYDIEHSSAMRPSEGSLPITGAPAAGWVLDLQVRQGTDGRSELWALSTFRDDIREQIRAGGWRWTSVEVTPHFVDPVSGKDLGDVLTAVALTNKPFVQTMEPIAASLEQFGQAKTPEEALVGLRRIFELSDDADAGSILEQITALRAAMTGGTVPEFVDVKYLLEQIRRMLGLGILSTLDQILGGAEVALKGTVPQEGGQSAAQETPNMAGILTTLAVLLSCAETESAVITAAKDAKTKADTAEAAADATDALGKLKAMFGSGDMQELIAKATKTIADAEALKPTLEALAAAQAALKSGAEQDAANEAQAVAASLSRGDAKLAERLQPGILASRTACINADGTVDPVKLDKFRKDFPLEEAQRALLSQRIVAGPNGQQLGGAVTGYRTDPITASAPVAGSANPTELDKLVSEVNSQPGRNPIEKCDALLCSRSAGYKAKPWGERVQLADVFSRKLLAGEMPVIPA